MKIQAQIGMVLNLDKCIGCHTCSVTCKNVWTTRKGVEYAWFNNVETKPGIGYPDNWENQEQWKGGWKVKNGKLKPLLGNKIDIARKIFANPHLPTIKDYYIPFTFNYSTLHKSAKFKTPPTARPHSMITGKLMEKIEKGPNWEDSLGGKFEDRSKETNFNDIEKLIYGEFENAFMIHLPRLCEHCLNPTCVAACPSGAIYKREKDGIVLIDQDRCRGWRECVSACPYKKIYFNWKTKKSEKCTFCYPKVENGEPTICSETCVGRIRYMGVLLYDADKILASASQENEKDLYQEHLNIFLDPHDPEIIKLAKEQGITDSFLEAAANSPIYKMVKEWKIAFPLHPEYRTLPMVWYTPPLSPIQSALDSGVIGENGIIPDVDSLRIPIQYLANLMTAGDKEPIKIALKKMLAMRTYMRDKTVDKTINTAILDTVGLTVQQVEEMYKYMAIANYNDRFVIPASHKEYAEDPFWEKATSGFPEHEKDKSVNEVFKNLFGGK